MTATEVLRRMLDERGVEYFKHEDGEPLRKLEKADEPATSWHMGGASVCAVPIEGSDLFDLWIDHCTPEQAIAATLGATDARQTLPHFWTADGTLHVEPRRMPERVQAHLSGEDVTFERGLGTCKRVFYEPTGVYVCSECGCGLSKKLDKYCYLHYCPNCGRRIEQ